MTLSEKSSGKGRKLTDIPTSRGETATDALGADC